MMVKEALQIFFQCCSRFSYTRYYATWDKWHFCFGKNKREEWYSYIDVDSSLWWVYADYELWRWRRWLYDKTVFYDYLGKRVAALLKRRVKQEESSIVSFGETTIDFDAYTAFIHGQKIDITAKELELVKMLFEYQGRVLTRKQMVDCLWGIDAPILDRTIDTYIKNIRKKLGIHTITNSI